MFPLGAAKKNWRCCPPTGFWQASEALGNDIIADKLDDLDDDALMQKLVQFEQICKDTLDQ